MKYSTALGLAIVGAASLLPAVARAQAVFTGTDQAATLDCRGGAALVRGSGNRLTIGGACSSLRIAGSGNVVAVDLAPGRPVRITGNDNRVLYHFAAGPPRAETTGAQNEVLADPREATPAERLAVIMAPPPVLVADGSSGYDLACGGRDVVVRGDGLRFVLRGGCRSLTVQGRSDTITAELLPGADVSIGGPAVILNYVLIGQGPAPYVRVTAPGLQATQIQHFEGNPLKLPTYR